jgi:hypothetical protein
MRLMVGGRTCSASASSPSDLGPLKTRTERAESWAGPMPLSRSRTRSRRSRRMAAERSWSATSVAATSSADTSLGEAMGVVEGEAAGGAGEDFGLGRFLCLTGGMEDS